MAEWLTRRRLRDMKCTVHDLEVMGWNPGQVELGVRSTSVQVVFESKIYKTCTVYESSDPYTFEMNE